MTTDLEAMYAWLDEEMGHLEAGLVVAVLSVSGRPDRVLRTSAKPPSKARRMRKRHRSRAKSRNMRRRRL